MGMIEETVSEPEYRSIEIMQSKKRGKSVQKVMNRIPGIHETMTTDLTFVSTRFSEGQWKVCSAKKKKILEQIKAENFMNLVKDKPTDSRTSVEAVGWWLPPKLMPLS